MLAAVSLKNLIKATWAPEEGAPIDPGVKAQLKQSVFGLAVQSQRRMKAQLVEVIASIAAHDFLRDWPELLEQMFMALSQPYAADPNVTNTALKVAHKLFKKYRYSFRSDELWLEIKAVVDRLFPPYFATAQQIYACLQGATSGDDLNLHVHSLKNLLTVFLSLSGQDIPQQFFDSLADWMGLFKYLLVFHPPVLGDNTAELYKLKSEVLKSVNMYASKYDEDFEPYCEDFCRSVWELLAASTGKKGYDRFVSSALDFFTIVTYKPSVAPLLGSNLSVMYTTLILPNMRLSEEDQELAETAPLEFVRMFLEDANEETRRYACSNLVKVLVKQFNEPMCKILSDHQAKVTAEFQAAPDKLWGDMDALIVMLCSAFPLLYTARSGASSIASSPEHIQTLYGTLIAQTLAHPAPLGILKSACLKFVYVYRNQFTPQQLLEVLGTVSNFLNSDDVILASYAGATLERLLMVKAPGQDRVLLLSKESLEGSLKGLLQSLNTALTKHSKNVHLMKAFFRVMWLAQETMAPYAVVAVDVLAVFLHQVMTNPSDSEPYFNSLIFECICLAVKHARTDSLPQIEDKLQGFMALIIQHSISDLLPYAFQVFGLLNYVKMNLNSYSNQLLESVLPLHNWEATNRYFAPSLVYLLKSVMRIKPDALHASISGMMQIVQQLFLMKLDLYAFELLTCQAETYDYSSLAPYLRDVYLRIFTKIHNSKMQNIRLTSRFHNGLIVFCSTFVIKHSAAALETTMNEIQPNILSMLVKSVFIPHLRSVETALDRKKVTVAFSDLLSSLQLPQDLWAELFVSVVKMTEMQTNVSYGTIYSGGLVDLPEDSSIIIARESFHRIYSADILEGDLAHHVTNEKQYLMSKIAALPFPNSSLFQFLGPLLDSEVSSILQTYSQAFGIGVY
jgi:exportin-2 (importin alpha re-exporter)